MMIRNQLTYAPDLCAKVGATAQRAWKNQIENNANDSFALANAKYSQWASEWPSLSREVFARLRDEQGLTPMPQSKVSKWGEHAISNLQSLSSWPALKSAAETHPNIALQATREITDMLAKAMNIESMSRDSEENPDNIQRQMDALSKLYPDPTPEQSAAVNEAISDLKYKQAKAEGQRTAMSSNLTQANINGALAATANEIAKKASEKAEKARICMAAGLADGKEGARESISDEMLSLVSADETLMQIIQELGKQKDALRASGTEKGIGHCDVVGVELSGDLRRVTPNEFAMFGHDALRGAALARLFDNGLQCFELQDENPKHDGDFVVLVDRSGSMSGQRMVFARAVALFTILKAHKSGRRVVLTLFSGTRDQETIRIAPENDSGLRDAMKALASSPRGGTNVSEAIESAARCMPDLRKPDVLLITDGIFTTPPAETIRKVKVKNSRITCVTIGVSQSIEFADDVIELNDNPQASDAVQIFRKVRK